MSQKNTKNIFDFWKFVMKHPRAILDNKRKRIINNAFKMGFLEKDLRKAIYGCSLTPHNMGDNDRNTKFDGIHIILRDADQIERFMRNADNPPKKGKNNERENFENENYTTGTSNGRYI